MSGPSGPSAYGDPQAHQPASLDPEAQDFTTNCGEDDGSVLDATYITHSIPDVPSGSHVVGLCTVPRDQAGMDNLGYHITDFLAFKYLLHSDVEQVWFAHCDVVEIVNQQPNLYVHGKDRRMIIHAEGVSDDEGTSYQGTYSHATGLKVQTDRQKLMADFLIACSVKAHLSVESRTPLIVVVCGPTNLQQDIFFGETGSANHLKSETISHAIGDMVEAIMVTPALFSAGWQVNPSFTRSPVQVRADRGEFLAKQFGGVFTKFHVGHFVGPTCPFFNGNGMNAEEVKDKFSNPFLSDEQKQLLADLKVTLHNSLVGRLSVGYGDHSFNFEMEYDDWEKLINARHYLSLDDYRKKWEKLGKNTEHVYNGSFGFLGDAFGGNKSSQLSHLKHLVKESFASWPAYWELPASNGARAIFMKLLDEQSTDENFCHEIFSVLEHRASLAVLGDATLRYMGISRPNEDRCRDWNEKIDFRVVSVPYKEIIDKIPGVYVLPGVNPDKHRSIQQYWDHPVFYLALAVVRHRALVGESVYPIEIRISDFFEGVKSRQADLLLSIPEIEYYCVAWLNTIGMPVCRLFGSSATTDKSPSITNEGSTTVDESFPALDENPAIMDESPAVVDENSAAVDQLEAPAQAAAEVDENVLNNAQSRPPQQPSQMQKRLLDTMAQGQSVLGVSTTWRTEAEIEEYFAENEFARDVFAGLLKKSTSDKAMKNLITSYAKIYENEEEDTHEDLISMKEDLDHVTQRYLIHLGVRDGLQLAANHQQAAAPQLVATPQPATTPQATSHQDLSMIPPHLRWKFLRRG
ncbi:hypothetical protein F5B19DRAFT_242417 [Rostrohypoxylon terebratum]|nr:hypothetical protein F5B19DRAFT_242417 [Rostrohypoxylon terebratum]